LDDEGAADDGLRGGQKEAGIFSVKINGGEEIWPTWWSSRRFRHGEMKMKWFARKSREEKGERKTSTI
jgi:hypothetical protein